MISVKSLELEEKTMLVILSGESMALKPLNKIDSKISLPKKISF